MTYLRTGWWLPLFGLMWIAALGAGISKIVLSRRPEHVAVWSYLVLAWAPIFVSRWLFALVPAAAIWWMLAGGACYTAGTLFLIHDDRRPYSHAVWHLFVMAASACHYATILRFVASWPGGF